MRFIRLLFVALLAIVLIAVALANRQMVTLSAFPANFGQFLGGTWSVNLPLFFVIFLVTFQLPTAAKAITTFGRGPVNTFDH